MVGLWSRLFGGGAPAPAAPGDLSALFGVPRDRRDDRWVARFLATIPDAPLVAPEPASHGGPDGFPYRNLDLPPGRGGAPTTLRASLGAILDAGEGATIFGADPRAPEWVFTFGDLLAFDLYGNFDGSPDDEPTEETNRQVTLRAGSQMMVGAPGESYFPARARRALGAYLHRRVAAGSSWRPGIALVVHPDLRPRRNLMLNIGLEELRGDQAALDTEMRFIRWFLPRRHGLLSRGPDIGDGAFQPL